MMITKDTRFSAVKAFVHWWLLGVAGLLPATWLAETMPTRELQVLCYGAGLVWVVWSAWYIGRRGERYTKRVKPIPHSSLAAYYGERTMDVIGAVAVATLAGGAAAGCCYDDDHLPYDK